MNFKNHIKKEFQNILTENCKILTEKWSISDEVEEYYEKILNDITLDIPNSDTEKIDNGIVFHTNVLENYHILEQTLQINYFIYNCSDIYLCDFVYDNGEKLNGYEENEKRLNITLYMVNGKWVEKYCEKNIFHEVEHILQINYGFKNNPNYTKLMSSSYDMANLILRSDNGYTKIDKAIAWVIYYSNSHEQDAFMQEYARELRRNPSLIMSKSSEIHQILRIYSYYAEYILDNIENIKVKNAIKRYKIYGYNVTNFKMMCTKQLNRFKKKMSNIEKNFKNNG